MTKTGDSRKGAVRVFLVIMIVLVWAYGVMLVFEKVERWFNEVVETSVYRSPTQLSQDNEYSVYESRNASQTFHFDGPKNIEKIVIPVQLPIGANEGQGLDVTIKKDDMTIAENYVFALRVGRNELLLNPTKPFLPVKDLRVIFTTPGFNDIPKASRVYREQSGNIAMQFYSSAIRKDLVFKKDATPLDNLGWYKLALLVGLVIVFPIVIIDPLVRGNQRRH